MRRTERRDARGFTLLEVVVALVIGMLAILMAAALMRSAARLTDVVADRVGTVDEQGAGELRLRRLVGQMTWSEREEPARRFSPERMRFTTWCEMPTGWLERCTAELELPTGGLGGLAARLSTGEDLLFLGRERLTGFLYLARTERGATWVERWTDGSSLPAAVGAVTATDTLILRIGERG